MFILFLAKIWKSITTYFTTPSAQSELESYLANHQESIHNIADLEYYISLFDERQRYLNRLMNRGDLTGYQFEKKYY